MSKVEDQYDETFFEIPIIDHPISYNEVHAVAIGAVIGLVVGSLMSLQEFEYAIGLTFTFTGYALIGEPFLTSLPHDDERHEDIGRIGLKTIKYEPWYALSAFAVSAFVVYTTNWVMF